MSEIRKLDASLVNKIAAGEVIERPASVVKELIENAIDAGAGRIDITLEEGGANLIKVSDDGLGIPGPQLSLAIEPHATSKIFTTDDLFNIRTLGFRGEALASIASVSRFRIVSRTAEQVEAYEIRDSELHAPSPVACSGPVGTTVEVRNLFYNVPARRKFLRQPPTELANATEQLARLALAHPQIAFSLTHNGRPNRSLPPTPDRRSRIADFYGPELAECLLPISRDERGLRVEALIAPPAQSRASTKWQYIFLNGRFIADRRIGFAIREAFRGLVEHDRYPVVFLFLGASCDAFDANVHPTKIEVRWRDAGLVQSQVLAVLRETLLSRSFSPSVQFDRPPLDPLGTAAADDPRRAGARLALTDYLKSVDPTQARLRFDPPRISPANLRPSIASAYAQAPTSRPPTDVSDCPAPASIPGVCGEGASAEGGGELGRSAEQPAPPAFGAGAESLEVQRAGVAGRFVDPAAESSVLQVHNTYIVAQTDEGMVIIDQHALHERILYERFRERILAGPLESQGLLMPVTLEASAARLQSAEKHATLLARLGIELSSFGKSVLAVQSFPTLLPDLDVAAFVGDLLDKLGEEGQTHSDETLIHSALDMMACKAAVKAGDALSAEEMQALLAQRHVTERSSNCPHGRPTTLQLTTRDLERQFRRI